MNEIFLSILIPAHNEEYRLPHTLEQVFAFLEKQSYTSEVIIIENGSTDQTFEVAQAFQQKYAGMRIFQNEERGKGLAVKRGIYEAQGEYIFLCDADLSMPAEEIPKFLPPACASDIAIASREAPGAIRYNEPYYRHLVGRVFNTLIRLLVLPNLQDTQCGFKCLRADLARKIFSSQTLFGWAFDVEILTIAHHRGYTIVEIPIIWYYNPGSKIKVLSDSFRMFLDLLSIRRNLHRGLYNDKN